jgi:hypothetical protein
MSDHALVQHAVDVPVRPESEPVSVVKSVESLYAVIVTFGDGGDDVRIGPIPSSDQADRIVANLKMRVDAPDDARGQRIAYDPAVGHLALVPLRAEAIAALAEIPQEARFPDLWTRLVAQEGFEEARRLWDEASTVYASIHNAPQEEVVQSQQEAPPAQAQAELELEMLGNVSRLMMQRVWKLMMVDVSRGWSPRYVEGWNDAVQAACDIIRESVPAEGDTTPLT